MLRKNWLPEAIVFHHPHVVGGGCPEVAQRKAHGVVHHFVEVVIAFDGHVHGRRLDGGFGQANDILGGPVADSPG